jgi:hypothetical protein
MHPRIAPLVSLCALLSLAACSKVDDMHDATMQMNATTARLANTSDKMNNIMGEIFDTGRQGAALDLRTKHYELVTHSPKLEDKATNACLYFQAFEFQLWGRLGVDNLEGERDRLLKDAALEFFNHMLAITHWDSVDPFAGQSPLSFGEVANEKASFNAFAIILERNNRKQELEAVAQGPGALSIRNMIENALRANKKIKAGQAHLRDYPAYIEEILIHEELATRLLKARYQMMGLTVLTQLTPIAKNYAQGFLYKIWGKKWELDFSKLNEAQLRLATFRLNEAMRARDVLAEIGIDVELDPSIRKVYANAVVKNMPGDRDEKSASLQSDAGAAQLEFISTLNAYTGKFTD